MLDRSAKKEQYDRLAPSKADDVFRGVIGELLDLLDEKRDSVFINGVELFATNRPDRDTMYIRPKTGFVPCGWITREWLKGEK